MLAVVTLHRIEQNEQSHSFGGDLLIWDTASRSQVLHWPQMEIESFAFVAEPFQLAAIVRKKLPDDPTRSNMYLSVWHAPEQESLQAKQLRYNYSQLLALLPAEGVSVHLEMPQLDRLLARYDPDTLERSGSDTVSPADAIRHVSVSDFSTSSTTPLRAEYSESTWGRAGAIDLLTGRHQLRLKVSRPIVLEGTFTNRFSPNLQYLVVSVSDVKSLYVVEFKQQPSSTK